MEQATPSDSGQATVQQMFATLLGEIASLRKQNEEQQRQLEHLRGDVSMLLECPNTIKPSRRMPHFKRLPLEIREIIWELAVPRRLLRFEGVEQESSVPSALSVPTIAHVCRESRRVVTSRRSITALTGQSDHLDGPSQMWRLTFSPHWTWFTSHKDALMINPERFRPYEQYERNHLIVQAAEHIIVEDSWPWPQDFDWGFVDHSNRYTLQRLSSWVHKLVPEPEYTGSTRDPAYNLRTIDFAMRPVTKIDRNYPPNFVHRLFAGDRVRIVDLRDKETVRGIDAMMHHELSSVMDSCTMPGMDWDTDLMSASKAFEAAASSLFPRVRSNLLIAFARCYYQASWVLGHESRATLPSPFRDGELDMEVTWVKELTKRISIRPVHVFVRAEGMSKGNF